MSTSLYWNIKAPEQGTRLPIRIKWYMERTNHKSVSRDFLEGFWCACSNAEEKAEIERLLAAMDKQEEIEFKIY